MPKSLVNCMGSSLNFPSSCGMLNGMCGAPLRDSPILIKTRMRPRCSG